MIEVRYATQADADDYYGGKYPHRTFRGVSIVEDGKTIVLGGIYRDKANHIAFSDFKVDPRKYKRHVVKATRMVMDMIDQYHHVYAIIGPDSPPNAREYIEHYGFEEWGKQDGLHIFIWRRKDHADDR